MNINARWHKTQYSSGFEGPFGRIIELLLFRDSIMKLPLRNMKLTGSHGCHGVSEMNVVASTAARNAAQKC